ncbi:MAG: NAD(P)/FAD-dependent oxidoreductase [Deltaproteobacteria bacterium]|nr:NAD(P)/FAD-dependent oxidoreductase [Deltaproteobacteria bacterium]
MFDRKLSRRSFLTISAMTAATLAFDWRKISAHAAKMGPKTDYPTVIIGAGLGGLCCGAFLAKQGIPVTVVEQHNIPGGYATSFDRAGGKFTFEVSLHGTSIHNNGPERALRHLGLLEKIQLVQLPEIYRLKTPKLNISVPQKDPEGYIRLLCKHFPSEAEGIRGFVEEIVAIAEETDNYSQKRKWFKLIFKPIFPIQYGRMWNVRNKTLADLLNDHVKDPGLQDILAALWGYYGLPPSKLSGFYYAVATGGYLKNGSYHIRQRSQDLSYALADVIEGAGGKVLYETPAKKILVKSGAVKGVQLSGGKTLPARAVVSNASALATFKEMLPPGAAPGDYLKKLNGYKPSISTFIVWLGLNRELRGKIKGFSTHVSSGRGSEADYRSCIKGGVAKGSYSVSIYDNVFEGYSRPGTSTLMLLFLCGYEPWRKFENDYRKGIKGSYHKEKERWTDILIQRAEKDVIPGLSSMIEVREAATPLTNQRYTGNTQGAIYGFEQSMDNAFMNRIDNKTPIKGLYLASAWGNPGGGFAGVIRAGQMAFEKMMEDWGTS